MMRWIVAGAIVVTAIATGGAAAGGPAAQSRPMPGNASSGGGAISGDGRFVAFTSGATNLVRGDSNGLPDVFVRDRLAGTTERVNVAADGDQANSDSYALEISADGRFVLFASAASNLAPDGECCWKVYVRDRQSRTTVPVSPLASPLKYLHGTISSDGRFVAFTSYGNGEIAGHRRIGGALFVWDRVTGTTEFVTEGGDTALRDPAISAGGRFVAFVSRSSSLVPGDSNGAEDVFVYDRVAGTTEPVSVGGDGTQANGGSLDVAISADGRLVAFDSFASNLTAGDNNGRPDVFVRDRVAATTTRVNESDGASLASVSPDGRLVAFLPRAPNGILTVVVRDITARTTEVATVANDGSPAENSSYPGPEPLSIDGRYVAFYSPATNLVPDDTNGADDVFVRDRLARTTELVSVGYAPKVKAGPLLLVPARPKAGKLLAAILPVSVDGQAVGAEATAACAASVRGRKLAALVEEVRLGTVRCVWRVPRDAKGKKLFGLVAVVTRDEVSAGREFAVRIS